MRITRPYLASLGGACILGFATLTVDGSYHDFKLKASDNLIEAYRIEIDIRKIYSSSQGTREYTSGLRRQQAALLPSQQARQDFDAYKKEMGHIENEALGGILTGTVGGMLILAARKRKTED